MHPKRREERAKLLTAALSNVGVAALIAGIVGPTLLGSFDAPKAVAGLAIGIAFHLLGQSVLHFVIVETREQKS